MPKIQIRKRSKEKERKQRQPPKRMEVFQTNRPVFVREAQCKSAVYY